MDKLVKTNKKIIYIADDDRAIVEALVFMLEDAGYMVMCAFDEKILGLISRKQPDLLILDIWMSGTDGEKICKALKKNSKTKKIPIIMVSANPDTEKISERCGADDYLTKPFEVDGLLGKIKDNLNCDVAVN